MASSGGVSRTGSSGLGWSVSVLLLAVLMMNAAGQPAAAQTDCAECLGETPEVALTAGTECSKCQPTNATATECGRCHRDCFRGCQQKLWAVTKVACLTQGAGEILGTTRYPTYLDCMYDTLKKGCIGPCYQEKCQDEAGCPADVGEVCRDCDATCRDLCTPIPDVDKCIAKCNQEAQPECYGCRTVENVYRNFGRPQSVACRDDCIDYPTSSSNCYAAYANACPNSKRDGSDQIYGDPSSRCLRCTPSASECIQSCKGPPQPEPQCLDKCVRSVCEVDSGCPSTLRRGP